MAISVQCRGCGKVHTVPDDWAGRIAKCNSCGVENNIPGPGMTPVQAPAEELEIVDEAPVSPVPPPVPPTIASPPRTPPPPAMRAPAQAVPGGQGTASAEAQGAADWESARRSGHLIALGVLLLLGFILPWFSQAGGTVVWIFPNLLGLWGGHMPLWIRIDLLYPLIAGVLAIVLGAAWEHRGRGILLLGLVSVPFIEAAARGKALALIQPLGGLVALATAMFLVAARARFYRPRWTVLYWIGLAAGGLVVAALLVPWNSIAAFGGQSVFRFFTAAFSSGTFAYASGEADPVSIAGLVMLVLFAIGVILTLCNVPRESGGPATRMAGLSGVFAVVGLLLLVGLVLFLDARAAAHGAQGRDDVELIVARIKDLFVYGGYLLVAIAGVADLIIGAARTYRAGRAAP